jgi:hypothetical protein
MSGSVIHFGVLGFFGPGLVRIEDQVTGKKQDSDNVYVFEPLVFGELNVAPWWKVSLGFGYRCVSGVDRMGLSESDLRGVIGDIVLKFGIF